jgi:CRISPR-associated protein Cmr1
MEAFSELTVHVRTVTPGFLHGADPAGDPELRPPAFRGVMRYWLRVALGGVIGDTNMAGLHKLETAVFGSTSAGSPVSVRISGDPGKVNAPLMPHKPWPRRQAFAAGGNMQVVMTMPYHRDPATWKRVLNLNSSSELDPTVWNMACAALRLALTFGGVGQRGRRGFGALQVVRADPIGAVAVMPTSLSDWRSFAAQSCSVAIGAAQKLAEQAEVPMTALPSGPTSFPCASALGVVGTCDLGASDANGALTAFMSAHRPEYTFGGISPREASPLWIRPIQTNSSYGLLLCALAPLGLNHDAAYYDRMRGFLGQLRGWQQMPPVKGWNT